MSTERWPGAGAIAALICVALLCALLAARGALAQTPEVSAAREKETAAGARSVDPETLAALHRGLAYLQARQGEKQSGAIGAQYPVAVTSLAGLAVLGAGYQPGQGPHGPMLERCLSFLERTTSERGFINEADNPSRMHGHCYAVLFLSELHGSLPNQGDRIADLIKRAVAAIEQAQSPRGGWYYELDHGGLDEASVTVCALQALRAARNAGFRVDGRRIDRAIRYVRDSQTRDGSFRYSLSREVDGSGRTTYALTVAALSTLNAAGVYGGGELSLGLDYVRRELGRASSPWRAAEEEHDYYANLYAAQALYQEGGELWGRWYPRVREHLLKKQCLDEQCRKEGRDGSWESRYGDEYATAVALLILEVPLGYLPIFQR